MRQRGARHVEVAVDIGAKGLVEALVADVLERERMFLERGVVDQHVEVAEFTHRAFDRGNAERGVLHVAGDQQAAPPLGLDAALRLRHRRAH